MRKRHKRKKRIIICFLLLIITAGIAFGGIKIYLDKKAEEIMTPISKLTYAKVGLTLSEANDMIWENKINCLPVVEEMAI